MNSESSRSAAIKTVAGAIAVATIVGCGMSLSIALIGIRLDAAGFSGQDIGINTAAGGLAALIAAPFIPWAARKIGVARLLMASLLVGGLALLGFTLSDNFTVWLILRFIVGLVVTIDFALSEFWITSWAPEGHRGFSIGIYATSLGAGFAIGPILLTLVGTAGNLPFYLGAALFLSGAIPLALNARGAPPLDGHKARSLLAYVWEAPAATFAALLQGAVEVAGMGLLPVYAMRAGLGIADGALFASLYILGSCMLQMPLGLLADRIDPRKLLIGLAMFSIVGAAILAEMGVGSLLAFEIVLLLWGGVVGTFYPVGLSLLATRYRGADLAGGNSAFVMAYAVGMLIGPPLIGAGLDFAPAGYFWAVAGLLGAYLIIALGKFLSEEGALRRFPKSLP